METRQQIAMKALIVYRDKVLIIREAATYGDGTQRGRYHLPGGRVEPGEAPKAALIREVLEETGLKIEVQKPLYVGEWKPVIKGVKHQIIAVFFVCLTNTDKVKLSTEHDDYKWIDPAKRHDFDIMDPEDKVIDQFLSII